jgi:hypothetical protein
MKDSTNLAGKYLRCGHRCHTLHFVANIFLTYKTEFPMRPPTKRKFLSNASIIMQDVSSKNTRLVW